MQEVVITIKEGKLRGKVSMSCHGRQYYSFQGIPYAQSPIGKLRFKAPEPSGPWDGVLDATLERSTCRSRHLFSQSVIGSEDCLFLNVYTPKLPSDDIDLLPVIVWIHGGAFVFGSGDSDVYGPDFLIAENIVLVTINYRLGIFGFLNFEDPSLQVPGNAGLKDQVMALKWTKNNIHSFCGNPNNVTISGWSAGAISVHYLMLSPMAKGLFHKAIMQSGSVLGCRARGRRSSPLLAKDLNLPIDNKQILETLEKMSTDELFELQENNSDIYCANKLKPYAPVVENCSEEHAFLSQDPTNVIKSGKYTHVPLLIGFTSREGIYVSLKSEDNGIIKDFENEVPYSLNLRKGSQEFKEVAQKIKKYFYGNEEPSLENTDNCYLLQSDNYFLRPIYNVAKYHVLTSTKPIFLYRAAIDARLNMLKNLFGIKDSGTSHGDELGYIFKNVRTPNIQPHSIEDITVRRFTRLWATFARNGDPNPIIPDPLINVTWKPVEKYKMHFLNIGENLTVGIDPEQERMKFWDELHGLP